MNEEWRDYILNHVKKFDEEKTTLRDVVNEVIKELEPTHDVLRYGIKESSELPYSIEVAIRVPGFEIDFLVNLKRLKDFNPTKSLNGATKYSTPQTREEMVNSFKNLVTWEVENKITL